MRDEIQTLKNELKKEKTLFELLEDKNQSTQLQLDLFRINEDNLQSEIESLKLKLDVSKLFYFHNYFDIFNLLVYLSLKINQKKKYQPN